MTGKRGMQMERAARMVCLLLIGLTLLFIWSNSMKDATASTNQSGFFKDIFEQIFDVTQEPFRFLHQNLRKVAHFLEFALLGGEVALYIFFRRRHGWLFYPLGACFCAAAAAVDEGIQYFVPGRAALWTDVLLDAAGACCGLLLVGMMMALCCRIFKKK